MARLADPIVVMDNVRFHSSPIVREELVVLGLESKYLPPYSPFFNPIENLFQKWKNFVKRQHPGSEEDLDRAINNVGNIVTPEDCAAYVTKSNNNCNLCANHGHDYFTN